MLLARVVGTVVPCVVADGLAGVPLLVLQPVDLAGSPRGSTLVAADPTRMAGCGELVTYEGGREAALLLDPWFVPVDHAVVGIVDGLDLPASTEEQP